LSDFWQNIEAAKEVPEQANITVLIEQAEDILSQLNIEKQLRLAGETLAAIAEIYRSKSDALLDNWQQKHEPTEPEFDEKLLAGLVRQSMNLDLADLLEPPQHRQRVISTVPEIESIAGEVDKQKLLQVLDREQMKQQVIQTSYDENVTVWCEKLSLWFSQHLGEECSLIQLVEETELSLGKVWLSILVGGFKIKRNDGDFYDLDNIFIEY
jgi:chromatin segregation and condensation protein Rec8/ScpA/Scc1 (kleisin family)